MTERQQAILALLDESGGGLALRNIHARLGPRATERQVREDLATLRTLGLAIPSGHGRGARWKGCESMDWPIPAYSWPILMVGPQALVRDNSGMTTFTESTVEAAALAWLESLGWEVKHGQRFDQPMPAPKLYPRLAAQPLREAPVRVPSVP